MPTILIWIKFLNRTQVAFNHSWLHNVIHGNHENFAVNFWLFPSQNERSAATIHSKASSFACFVASIDTLLSRFGCSRNRTKTAIGVKHFASVRALPHAYGDVIENEVIWRYFGKWIIVVLSNRKSNATKSNTLTDLTHECARTAFQRINIHNSLWNISVHCIWFFFSFLPHSLNNKLSH